MLSKDEEIRRIGFESNVEQYFQFSAANQSIDERTSHESDADTLQSSIHHHRRIGEQKQLAGPRRLKLRQLEPRRPGLALVLDERRAPETLLQAALPEGGRICRRCHGNP